MGDAHTPIVKKKVRYKNGQCAGPVVLTVGKTLLFKFRISGGDANARALLQDSNFSSKKIDLI